MSSRVSRLNHRFDLIIFDCDGVLVDSERITNTIFAEMLNVLGLKVTLKDMYRDFVGRSMAACLRDVEQRLGYPVPADFVSEFRERTGAALSAGLKPVAGIHEALARIHVPCCVASSGDHEKMRMTLGLTGLLDQFDGRLFSSTEVPHEKPHPGVFLYAAERMGAVPERTAVVEDTVVGVTAGVQAGMTVFGYAELSDPDVLGRSGAVVFSDMADLPTLLDMV